MPRRPAVLLAIAIALSGPASATDDGGTTKKAGDAETAGFVARTHGAYRHYQRVHETLDTYDAEDIMEIVPYGRTEAYIRMRTMHGNYHVCSLYGIFRAERDAYVFERRDPDPKGLSCRMRIALKGGAFTTSVTDFRTGNNQVCLGSCGARGSFDNQKGFALRQRRPIRYMKSLMASPEYEAAIAHREGRIARPDVIDLPDTDAPRRSSLEGSARAPQPRRSQGAIISIINFKAVKDF